jgi:hypothetical protein
MASPIIPSTADESVEVTTAWLTKFLDEWHDDAANSRPAQFDKTAPEGISIGTHRTEGRNREELKTWAAEYFANPSARSFKPLTRNVVIEAGARLAWFDEPLSSGMGVLQTSCVLRIEGEVPETLHDRLSFPIRNGLVGEVTKLVQGAGAQ